LRIALVGAEIRRVVALPLSALGARELVLRAFAISDKDQSLAGTIRARELIDEALRRDPNLEPALVARAWVADFENGVDPHPDHDRFGREMDEFTSRAISLDPSDPTAWKWRAAALISLGRWDAALEANAMAIKLDPDDPNHYVGRAWLMNLTGRPDEALTLIDRALAMHPNNIGWTLRTACEAHLLSGQAEEAIATCEKAMGTNPYWYIHLFLAAAYANHGDVSKAAATAAYVLRTVPNYTISQMRAKPYSDNPEYIKLADKFLYTGLRTAGIPDN